MQTIIAVSMVLVGYLSGSVNQAIWAEDGSPPSPRPATVSRPPPGVGWRWIQAVQACSAAR